MQLTTPHKEEVMKNWKKAGYLMPAILLTLAVVAVLAGCDSEPVPPRRDILEMYIQEGRYLAKNVEAGIFDHSTEFMFNALRRNDRWLVGEYNLTTRQELLEIYHSLALGGAVYQLRAATHDIVAPGPNGNPNEVMAALDTAQAYGSFLHEVVGISKLGAGRIADSLEVQRNIFPELGKDARLSQYIAAIRSVGWVDNLGLPGRVTISGK